MKRFRKSHMMMFVMVLAAGFVLAACAGGAAGGTAITDVDSAAQVFGFTQIDPGDDGALSGNMSVEFTPGSLANQVGTPADGEGFAIIHTNFGEIHVRLFPEYAPLAVQNFVTHSINGFYDGIIFHRVIEDFMIQGGDPMGTGGGGESIWGRTFGDEFTPNRRHIRGALAMANAGPSTNGSQFYIVHNGGLDTFTAADFESVMGMQDDMMEDGVMTYGEAFPSEFEFIAHYLQHGGTPHLDFGHTVFGQVFIGMDIVDAIATTPVDGNSRPVDQVIIERIEIMTFGR